MTNLDLFKMYSRPQQGGELPYFVGKQYGSGWLRTIGRFAFPILRKLGLMAADTAEDVIMKDKPILPTLQEHAMKAVGSVLPKLFNNGSGVKNSNKKSIKGKTSINKRRRMHGTIFH